MKTFTTVINEVYAREARKLNKTAFFFFNPKYQFGFSLKPTLPEIPSLNAASDVHMFLRKDPLNMLGVLLGSICVLSKSDTFRRLSVPVKYSTGHC